MYCAICAIGYYNTILCISVDFSSQQMYPGDSDSSTEESPNARSSESRPKSPSRSRHHTSLESDMTYADHSRDRRAWKRKLSSPRRPSKRQRDARDSLPNSPTRTTGHSQPTPRTPVASGSFSHLQPHRNTKPAVHHTPKTPTASSTMPKASTPDFTPRSRRHYDEGKLMMISILEIMTNIFRKKQIGRAIESIIVIISVSHMNHTLLTRISHCQKSDII